MSRWNWYVGRDDVVGNDELTTRTKNPLEDQLRKLVQLLPVEVVSLYTAGDAFARTAPAGTPLIAATIAIAVIGLILVPFAFIRVRGVKWADGKTQILVGCVSYLLWTYAIGGWAPAAGVYYAFLAGLAIVVFLGIVGIFKSNATR